MPTSDPALRIFSYQPNPRIFKATIVARLCGIELDLRGAPVPELADWLWDFDARPLSEEERSAGGDAERQRRVGFRGRLFKTDAFLEAHPFVTVPAAFGPDGSVGIFESNSIMRAAARVGGSPGGLYGDDPYSASRIDSFLDVSLVFARQTQIYLLGVFGEMTREIWDDSKEAYQIYLSGIERALAKNPFLVGEVLTLADICFVCELVLCLQERGRRRRLVEQGFDCVLDENLEAEFPKAFSHLYRLVKEPAFAPDCEPYLAKLAAAAGR